jgi:2-polyprenyl-3-methyl-5-hydroxy-6-metoxy-1,4-benzoquinol methylase
MRDGLPLTPEHVRLAYRLFLGRDPENDDVIEWHIQKSGSLQALRRSFLFNSEFQSLLMSEVSLFPVGLHLDVEEFDVQVSASPAQLAEMLKRTADVWRSLGQTEPHWSVLTDSAFLASNIAETKREFYRSGRGQIARVGALLHRNGLEYPKNGTCLDFGCGVGRLTLALGPRCGSVMGVDVSEGHLRLAEEQRIQDNARNVSFSNIRAVEDIDALPTFDMLLTLIVLQHNPPPIIRTILDRLLSRLNAGGIAVFQVPTFRADYRFSVSKYLAGPPSTDMEMHPLPQRHIHDLLDQHSCRLIEVRDDALAWRRDMVSQTFLVKKTP